NEYAPPMPGLPPIPDAVNNRFDRFCERIYFQNNVYHSYAYRFKRNSNSYMVSYSNDNQIKYGTVLYYAYVEDSDDVWMVMSELKPTARNLFTRDMKDCIESDKINTYLERNQLGYCFTHVTDSNDLVVHRAKFLISRVVMIPDDAGGYVSYILNCYQHD
uniref:Uncharacterized protein n=1 Tax=Clytia hemisphaerica TaxID=252671 RepID=A0A7M5X8Q7_9CNID